MLNLVCADDWTMHFTNAMQFGAGTDRLTGFMPTWYMVLVVTAGNDWRHVACLEVQCVVACYLF